MAVYKRDMVDINLETGNIHRSFLQHSIGFKDQQADHFGIRAFRNGEQVNLTGVSIQGIFMPPQGSPIAITSGNIVNYNEAEVVLPQACYNYNGQFTLAIKLVDPSNSVTGTMRIVDGMVDNTNASGTVAPVAAIPSYQEVLSTYEQAIAAINKTVRFDAVQSLTDTQKQTARNNISAASVADLQAETTAREAADTAINNAIGTVPSGKTVQGQIDTLESGKVPKTTTVNGHALSADVTVTKGDVGLGNVDNTSDANKPISTAQAAVNTQVSNIIGNTSLPTTAQTLTGAIAEHEGDLTNQQGQITDLKSALTSNRTGTIELNPMAVYRYSSDSLSVVDFASMPLNTYCYAKFSVFKTALTNANFPLTWADNDYVRMERMAATRNNQDISIITLHNFTKTEKAEMIYFASTSTNKYRWLLPVSDLTKQYFPADAKAVGDALALKENISTLTANRSYFYIKPWGHYSLTEGSISALDFRDMPMNTYVFTTYSVIKAGLTDTGMPDNDWSDGDYVAVFKKEITSNSSTANSILEFYNLTKTRKLEMIYYASSSTNKYRWVSSSGGTVNYNTFENTINQYSNSYTVTATPSITTDTNNYLQPSGDTTDMSTAIETMLTQTGICNLAPGDFYVSGIDMPDDSMIRGCGTKTNIILLNSVTSGYAIKMGTRCIVDSVMISGGTSAPTITSTIGTRNGILWQGTAIPGESTTSSIPTRGTISNCYIRWFSGSGIYCYGTGTGISNCLNVVNAFVFFSTVGINISWLSEFHRFTNVDCRGCYYGIINNGGNNTFANCGFSKNIVGLLMDNTNGQSSNNSHGSFSNCVFNHSGENNDGIAIHIIGCTNGEMFTGCQVFYGETVIAESEGIVFANCNFGEGSNSTKITITNGGLVMYNGCCFKSNPTVTKTGNTATKFVNCYLRDGTTVTVN